MAGCRSKTPAGQPAPLGDEMEVKPRPPTSLGSRHLVLNFDINKTLVMNDSVTGKSMSDMANHIIAASTWGSVEELPEAVTDTGFQRRWSCRVSSTSIHRPSADLVSYVEFMDEQMPGKEVKERRESYFHRFTEPGAPGEVMRPHFDKFMAALRLPESVVGGDAARRAGLRSDAVFIIPAFFELLLHLKRVCASFCIVFRTFGKDLEDVVVEFNAFCEGQHPLFPGAVFDGRDGGADYRISFDDPSCFGTFFRSSISGTQDALVYGTLEQPPKAGGLEFYDDASRFPRIEVVCGGIAAVYRNMRPRISRPGTLALRDYFPLWRQQDFGKDATKHNGGKMMILESSTDRSMQSIFFDDNVGNDSPRIVDVRLLSQPLKTMSIEYLSTCHVVKAEPLESVVDPTYFTRHVERLAAAYDRRMVVCQRMRKLLMDAQKANKLRQAARSATEDGHENQKYDPWSRARRSLVTHSHLEHFPEEEPEDHR